MGGSVYGKIFKVTTWGESHGAALGAVIDGCPAGVALCEGDIQAELDRRKPNQGAGSSKRAEADAAELLSGVFEGKTTGAPIAALIRNKAHNSADYAAIKEMYRPGHADFNFDAKYGFRDYRGGGRSSGRETAGRVIAGAVAKRVLAELGVCVAAKVLSIGGLGAGSDGGLTPDILALIEETVKNGDSLGGIVECVISGLPLGVGEPVFDKLDANLAKAVMSIGAVKAVEFGNGFKSAGLKGSENNDGLVYTDGQINKITNNSGGITGGLSDGVDIIFRAAIKPTPSISKPQRTMDKSGENVTISVKGRHDAVIAPRAVVVVEAMAAVTVTDLLLMNILSRIDTIKKLIR